MDMESEAGSRVDPGVEAAVVALEQEMARQVHPQLDPASYPLLTVLVRNGATRVSDLGAALELDKSTVSRQIDAAARLGLVERVPDQADARARLVTLTALGQQQMDAVYTRRLDRWRASLATWGRRTSSS